MIGTTKGIDAWIEVRVPSLYWVRHQILFNLTYMHTTQSTHPQTRHLDHKPTGLEYDTGTHQPCPPPLLHRPGKQAVPPVFQNHAPNWHQSLSTLRHTLTVKLWTETGKVAENSKTCRLEGKCPISRSIVPVWFIDSSLSAYQQTQSDTADYR